MWIDFGKYLVMFLVVSSGQVAKKPAWTAFVHIEIDGLKAAAWRNLINLEMGCSGVMILAVSDDADGFVCIGTYHIPLV